VQEEVKEAKEEWDEETLRGRRIRRIIISIIKIIISRRDRR
jgi:hypothetical protein